MILFSINACFKASDMTKEAFSNPHSGIIDIASAHKLTITLSRNVTEGSFKASFITQSESDSDFQSEVRISLSSFSYSLIDWSSFFTLLTSLFAALKNPEALAEKFVLKYLFRSLLFLTNDDEDDFEEPSLLLEKEYALASNEEVPLRSFSVGKVLLHIV